ncbi:CRISPR-associated protein, Csd1 family [Marvinbryantia formatexigens DSM 14469]|uniref:CRISPR-associated protein, Csd1 family n=1 Tax=Marvinbryantia formatexigens DSM 14469 TaxID=478749 RepID=C6LAR2_9FIRM|nr:type I-C CRISPR-associated protein Cas8c/Csd1 [Marvinbryantia formatexigens]EET62043.1 CRISPR-associated protein, Csd1 family [Marvinbryantia formatexigens DSM 14469]UWO26583.1 type I-C CRISPR-associated protein Cas8c/Csd1 [Marvinbryantia formatexigens DSM 14469]SDH13097.1 CRISPR-associated protein Csd1 [Marvinbryantia formatexigens]
MILQALVNYYETLQSAGKIAQQGWCQAKVSFALNLDEGGRLKGIISLKTENTVGKKKVVLPAVKMVPEMVTRSSGISANFLCDNSKYLLGIDAQGTGKRVLECFEAAKNRHLEILKSAEGKFASAVKAFFSTWEPQRAKEYPALQEMWEEITGGGNLIFVMDDEDAQDDEEIRRAWKEFLDGESSGREGICMVTGKKTEIARIHSTIKGVQGAQSSGAALVSFNGLAFESYGKEQSYNAPVGKYAAFAYTTALNYLLAQRDYVFRFGDTTVVFWAEDGEEAYQEVFGWSLEPPKDNQEEIKNIFKNLRLQKAINIEGIELNKNQRFYILGLAPNAARLSVRFYYEDSFGNLLENMQKHYQRMELVKPSWEEREYLGTGAMLYETVNQKSKDKKPVPNLPGALLRAILSDSRYPENLYSSTLIRIRAEQGKVTWGRAAIIKAYLIKNHQLEKEENFVGLNEETNDTAYVLGRLFAVLEAVQEEANPGVNATIRDRYFNAACATPGAVFPILMKLKNSHIRKIERQKIGKKVYLENLLTQLMGKIEDFPKRLTLEEQGHFILGYYHQVQKRYEKREEA